MHPTRIVLLFAQKKVALAADQVNVQQAADATTASVCWLRLKTPVLPTPAAAAVTRYASCMQHSTHVAGTCCTHTAACYCCCLLHSSCSSDPRQYSRATRPSPGGGRGPGTPACPGITPSGRLYCCCCCCGPPMLPAALKLDIREPCRCCCSMDGMPAMPPCCCCRCCWPGIWCGPPAAAAAVPSEACGSSPGRTYCRWLLGTLLPAGGAPPGPAGGLG